jgi:hypothetical protein
VVAVKVNRQSSPTTLTVSAPAVPKVCAQSVAVGAALDLVGGAITDSKEATKVAAKIDLRTRITLTDREYKAVISK